jgi:hypothetical protein
MTELFIDGQKVVLPKNFSWTIIEENPFFTKNGKYTYDLELSLNNPQNAKIYKHINRINNIVEFENRKATLIADNEVVLNGTEIILEITDISVKIQLVSGESELNFLIGGNKKLNTLNFGQELLENSFFPVYSKNKDLILGSNRINFNYDGTTYDIIHSRYSLLHIKLNNLVTSILNNLGYEITNSFFDYDPWFNILIVSGIRGSITDKLPDWTINDFFNELEKLFNVVFIINEFTNEIDILPKNQFYHNAQKYTIDKVLDNFNKKIDKENKQDYSIANIGYDLTDDDYFKYQNLDPEILEMAGNPIHYGSYEVINNYMNDSMTNKTSLKGKFFIADNTNTWYIAWFDGENTYMPKKVNCLRPIRNNQESSDIDIELKIIPVPMVVKEIPVYKLMDDHPSSSPNYNLLYNLIIQMPELDTNEDRIVSRPNSNDLDIQETLENDSQNDVAKIDTMSLAFYTGYQTVLSTEMNGPSYIGFPFPVAFVDFLKEDDRTNGAIDPQHPSLSFRLDDPNGLKPLYEQSISIDTTKEYTFKFMYNGKLDSKNIFIINNKEFFCKEIRRVVNIDGFEKIIEGDFYAKLN